MFLSSGYLFSIERIMKEIRSQEQYIQCSGHGLITLKHKRRKSERVWPLLMSGRGKDPGTEVGTLPGIVPRTVPGVALETVPGVAPGTVPGSVAIVATAAIGAGELFF